MASHPRGGPMLLPPLLLEAQQKLVDSVRVFQRLYREYGGRMEAAARKFQELAQNDTVTVRMIAAVLEVGLSGLGVAIAFITGASRMVLSATLGTLALGIALVAMIYPTNNEMDTSSMDIVGQRAGNFTEIIERLRDSVLNIKEASEEFQEMSSLSVSGADVVARNLRNSEQFQQLLKQTAELVKRSGEAFGMADSAMMGVRELQDVIIEITPIGPTPVGNVRLRNCIENMALQSKKLVQELNNFQVFLQNFDQM